MRYLLRLGLAVTILGRVLFLALVFGGMSAALLVTRLWRRRTPLRTVI